MSNDIFNKTTDDKSFDFIKELNSKESNKKFFYIFGIIPSIFIILFAVIKLFNVSEAPQENYKTNKISKEYREFISITNEIANLRDQPGVKNSNIISKAYSGDKLMLLSRAEENWYKVLTADKDTAFVHANLGEPIRELVEFQTPIETNSLPEQNTNSEFIKIIQVNPILKFVLLGLLGIPIIYWNNYLYRVDKKRKSVKRLYSLDQVKEVEDSMLPAFKNFEQTKKKWQLYNQKNNFNTKYNAGATVTVERKELKGIHRHKLPNPYFITNVSIPSIELYNMEIFFLPDQLLIKKSNRYAGVKYKFLEFEKLHINFRESDGAPSDTQVMDYTYLYVNKNGDPDLRFNYNPQIPICAYSEYHISFGKEFNETIMTSNANALDDFIEQLNAIALKQGRIKLLSEEDKQLILDNESTKNIMSKSNFFSREYYELLIEISARLSKIKDKLKNDLSLIDNLKNNLVDASILDIVPYLVYYDMVQILKILSNGELKAESAEITGLALLSNIISDSKVNFLSYKYETISTLLEKGNFKDVTNSILKIADHPNPIKISIVEEGIDKSQESDKIDNVLSLPSTLKILNHPLFYDYVTTQYRFATVIAKADGIINSEEEAALKEIYNITHNPKIEGDKNQIKVSNIEEEDSLQDVLNELDSLIGLDEVKKEVNTLINFVQIQKERAKQGLKSPQVSYHCVFTGSPGTGKTTIARLVAKIYKHLGILSKGHLVETDRSGLVAGYVGQTSAKVDKVVEKSLDGVLFIDEAYSLAGEDMNDYGDEAISTLIKRMEDNRDRLVLIVAGYPDEMKTFIESNPGLKSRFNRYINFPDYTPVELMKIFELFCSKSEYNISAEAKVILNEMFKKLRELNSKDFGNGRLVRNIFEKTIEKQSNRIANVLELTKEILITIEVEDIPNINI